jgi:xanthine dehydrogenase large subunit
MMGFVQRVSLSEHAHYGTPGIYFDPATEKGNPFSYHVYGTAITTVTVDCLRGIYEIDSVKLVHDIGSGMNPLVDTGQVEGGLIQGIGWMTMEELIYDQLGRLRSNSLSTYKVPDIYSVPKTISVFFLESEKENAAILRSKAVGEPPLMYGIGTFFALRNAIRAFNPVAPCPFSTPMTPEKVLLSLYHQQNENAEVTTQAHEKTRELTRDHIPG